MESSDENVMFYSGEESPPLASSDLCNSDVDTDELIYSGVDTDEELSNHEPIVVPKSPPPIKKKSKNAGYINYTGKEA